MHVQYTHMYNYTYNLKMFMQDCEAHRIDFGLYISKLGQ